MRLSVVIPARNEEEVIGPTLRALIDRLRGENILYEIVVVDDGCTDSTFDVASEAANGDDCVRLVRNPGPNGFGNAVCFGIDSSHGDAVAIFMADASDSPDDLVRYYREIQAGAECVFGSRFIRGSKVIDYPPHKLVLNRLANWFIKFIFGLSLNDTTNAFKCYRREVIDGVQPLISHHFNLTVELPLKAIIRGYQFKVIPISWTNRAKGISKLKIKEMGSRYLFIVLYLWLEHWLSRGDYRRDRQRAAKATAAAAAASRLDNTPS